MKIFLQFVTTPTDDTPGTALLLHYEDKRYLFGSLAEGSQRSFVERGARVFKVRDIYLTGKTEWARTGGLMGMLLTHADNAAQAAESTAEYHQKKIETSLARLEKVTDANDAKKLESMIQRRRDMQEAAEKSWTYHISGGPNLAHTIATARRFVCRKGMAMKVREFCDAGLGETNLSEPTVMDPHLKLWALSIYPSSTTPPSPQQQPRNPSKRTFNEFLDDSASRQTKNRAAYDHVLGQMFDSDWDPSRLREHRLADVPMPAKIFVRNEAGEVVEYTGPKPGDDCELPDIQVLVRDPWPGAMVSSIPETSPSECAMSYIVRIHDIRGKLDAKKARELGVTHGPDYRRLTEGHSVVSTNGNTITPEMVMSPKRTGKAFAIIDLPSVAYVESLLDRAEWKSEEATKGLEIFVWCLGPGVAEDPRLHEFIQARPQCKHILSSRYHCLNSLVFGNDAVATTQFREIDSERYQTPQHEKAYAPNNEPSVLVAHPGLTIDFEPTFGISPDCKKPPDVENVKVADKVREDAMEVRKRFESREFQERLASFRRTLPSGDAEIIALGTGSSCPSLYRNVSATLLRVPGYGSYLLDCGEGTLGQLRRTLGPSELKAVFRELKMIWISHTHADHHLGLASVIKAWYEEVFGVPPPVRVPRRESDDILNLLDERRLCVVSHPHMLSWLEEYSSVENFGYDKVTPLQSRHGEGDFSGISECVYYDGIAGKPVCLDFKGRTSTYLQRATGLSNLLSLYVPHCHGARAVSLVFPSGFKFSYSGDCRPSEAFANMGKGSTVLLHEATFEDAMLSDAISKRHSTISEALEVGRQMEAKVIVLTHFSQRYREMPLVDKLAVKQAPDTSRRSERPRSRSHSRSRSSSPSKAASEKKYIPSAVLDVPPSDETEVDYTFRPAAGEVEARHTLEHVPVIQAFDHMRLRVEDALHAEAYMPVFKKHLLSKEGEPKEAEDGKKGENETKKNKKGRKEKKKAEKEKMAEAA